MSTAQQKQLTTSQVLVIAVMLSGAFIAMLNQTFLSPALPKIMADLQITASDGQWLTTGYMLVSGIMIPISAFLINKFTTRQLYLSAMGLFAAGTIIAAIPSTFQILLFARVLQAMGTGILMPMLQTILLLIFPKEKRGMAMGLVGLIFSFAPAIGPTLAGVIVDQFTWHALFYLLAPLVVLDIIIAFFVLTNIGTTTNPTLDYLSVVYSTLGFGGLLYGFSSFGSHGISTTTCVALLVGCIALYLFIRRQLSLPEPLLQISILKNPVFLASTVLGMIINASLLAGGIIFPIYVQTICGYSATMSGLILLPGSILMGILSPFVGSLFDKFGPRILALSGLTIMATGTAVLIFIDLHTPIWLLVLVYTYRMLGIALTMMPLNTWGLNALENHLLAHGAAVNNTLRQVAGSIGTALLVSVMSLFTVLTASEGMIASTTHGINMAFAAATILSIISLTIAYLTINHNKGSKKNRNQLSQ